MSLVTLEKFVDDCNVNGYNFLCVLSRNDMHRFIGCLKQEERNFIYENKGILLHTWLTIMNSMDLFENYEIYRRSYDGESYGHRKCNDIFTDMLIKTYSFKSSQNSGGVIKILVHNGKMEILDLNKKILISSWACPDFHLENQLYN